MFNLKLFIDWCLPSQCLLCFDTDPTRSNLCVACRNLLPTITHACERCGIPTVTTQTICGECIQHPPPFDRLISLYRYETPLPHWLQQWKFHQQLHFARVFSNLLWQPLRAHYQQQFPDAILAMPLHHNRLRQRGFNQAEQLARVIAQRSHRPLLTDAVVRSRDTLAQSKMAAVQRTQNIKNAFQVIKPLPRSVLVIDDVVTTGNTITELCKTLRKAGVTDIDVWTCARAIKQHPKPAGVNF